MYSASVSKRFVLLFFFLFLPKLLYLLIGVIKTKIWRNSRILLRSSSRNTEHPLPQNVSSNLKQLPVWERFHSSRKMKCCLTSHTDEMYSLRKKLPEVVLFSQRISTTSASRCSNKPRFPRVRGLTAALWIAAMSNKLCPTLHACASESFNYTSISSLTALVNTVNVFFTRKHGTKDAEHLRSGPSCDGARLRWLRQGPWRWHGGSTEEAGWRPGCRGGTCVTASVTTPPRTRTPLCFSAARGPASSPGPPPSEAVDGVGQRSLPREENLRGHDRALECWAGRGAGRAGHHTGKCRGTIAVRALPRALRRFQRGTFQLELAPPQGVSRHWLRYPDLTRSSEHQENTLLGPSSTSTTLGLSPFHCGCPIRYETALAESFRHC